MKKYTYVSELSGDAQSELKSIIVDVLMDTLGSSYNSFEDNGVNDAMDSKISDLDEFLTNEQIAFLQDNGVVSGYLFKLDIGGCGNHVAKVSYMRNINETHDTLVTIDFVAFTIGMNENVRNFVNKKLWETHVLPTLNGGK